MMLRAEASRRRGQRRTLLKATDPFVFHHCAFAGANTNIPPIHFEAIQSVVVIALGMAAEHDDVKMTILMLLLFIVFFASFVGLVFFSESIIRPRQ
jgi:hypothetical protein